MDIQVLLRIQVISYRELFIALLQEYCLCVCVRAGIRACVRACVHVYACLNKLNTHSLIGFANYPRHILLKSTNTTVQFKIVTHVYP